MRMHQLHQKAQRIADLGAACFPCFELQELLPLLDIQGFIPPQVSMVPAQAGQLICQLPIRRVKRQPAHVLQRQIQNRKLVLPFCTQLFLMRNFQSLEQAPAVFLYIEKFSQHAHCHCFSKPPRPGKQHDFRSPRIQQLFNKSCFINIIAALGTYLGKIRNSYRN